MRQRLILTIGILALLTSLCFAAWDNTKPADVDAWNDAAGFIRDNNDALEAALGLDLDSALITNPYVDVRAFSAKADSGTTDNTTPFVNAIATGKNVYIPFVPGQYYKITNELTLANANQIIFSDGAEVRQATGNKAGFLITASDVEIRGLVIVGPDFANASSNNERGVSAVGADKDNFIAGIKVVDCKISIFGDYGIYLDFVEDFEITHNFVDSIFHAGIQGLHVRRGNIESNKVTNITGSSPAYGIVLTREANDSLVTKPRPTGITISNNIVDTVTNWEGIDVHSGENISIVGNTVRSCIAGIVATATDNGSAAETFASLNITIVGNVIDSGVTDGTVGIGIQHAGASANSTTITNYGTGCITGNTVIGHGIESSLTSGGISIQHTKGMSITGNTLIACSPIGIHIRRINEGFIVSGNSVIDSWTDTVLSPAGAYGVYVESVLNVGYIGGNSFRIAGDKTGSQATLNVGIDVFNSTNVVDIGLNHSEAATYIRDLGQKTMRGLYPAIAAVTGTTNVTDMATTSIPANYLGIGQYLKVIAAGTITDVSAGTKAIIFKFGAKSITIQAAANTNTDWRFEALIEYTLAAEQDITWFAWNGVTPLQGFDEATVDMTAAVIMEVTGQLGDGNDAITQEIWKIEKY